MVVKDTKGCFEPFAEEISRELKEASEKAYMYFNLLDYSESYSPEQVREGLLSIFNYYATRVFGDITKRLLESGDLPVGFFVFAGEAYLRFIDDAFTRIFSILEEDPENKIASKSQ